MHQMDLTGEILNHSLDLSMEFGENWLMDIDGRLATKFPDLDRLQLEKCNTVCKEVNKAANRFVFDNPMLHVGSEIQFVDTGLFEQFMLKKYNWISKKNLQHLYSQSCYYALK